MTDATPSFGFKRAWVPWVLLGCAGFLLAFLVVGVVVSAVMYLRTSREPAPVVLPAPAVTPPPVTPTPVVPATVVPVSYEGELGPGDTVRDDGSWIDTYPVQVLPGDHLVVTLQSDAFDAYLTLRSPSGQRISDDDSGGGTNARVELSPTESGTWEVWANSLSAGSTGAYRLTIERSR